MCIASFFYVFLRFLHLCPLIIGFRKAFFGLFPLCSEPGVRHLCSPKRSSLTLQPIGKWAFFMKLFVKFEYFLCCNCCIFILNVI